MMDQRDEDEELDRLWSMVWDPLWSNSMFRNSPDRPGWQTTEFWITVVLILICGIALSLRESDWLQTLLLLSASTGAATSYTLARTWLKRQTMVWWREADEAAPKEVVNNKKYTFVPFLALFALLLSASWTMAAEPYRPIVVEEKSTPLAVPRGDNETQLLLRLIVEQNKAIIALLDDARKQRLPLPESPTTTVKRPQGFQRYVSR